LFYTTVIQQENRELAKSFVKTTANVIVGFVPKAFKGGFIKNLKKSDITEYNDILMLIIRANIIKLVIKLRSN